ncbi:glycosyltransferase family 4 protein [Curtobacterium sp. MCBD17_032]|uniref:glycosyltransferase family 4 protein n=1 Tax=Curtobacterium sp. MCBD17_032 TaxID=2175659 RepID=UPI000DA999E8|nr:glycosyltransferase family 4 protein [Curtobacterium sp. MCBD17_032]PZE84980.1 glycosyl transferase [Curtobacterium sp. MCBD17_032]
MPRHLRIAIVGPTHPYSGGIATHTTSLAHRLQDAGHRVHLLSWKAQYPAFLRSGTTRVPESEPEVAPFPSSTERLAWYNPLTWIRAGLTMRGADVVVVTGVTPYHAVPYAVMHVAAGRRPRGVVLAHNVLPHEHGRFDERLVRMMYRQYGAVLVHSDEQAALARGIVGDDPDVDVRVARLPLADLLLGDGPDSSETTTDPEVSAATSVDGTVTVGFFGMVRHYKGVDQLLEAAARVPGVRVVVRGEFWQPVDEYREQARSLGIEDRVEVVDGYVAMSDMAAMIRGFDVVALPYRSGSSSINVALAHRFGTPVLATDAGTLALDVRDGVDGLVVPADDVDALTEALRRLVRPGELARLRSGVDQHASDRMWTAYTDTVAGFVGA